MQIQICRNIAPFKGLSMHQDKSCRSEGHLGLKSFVVLGMLDDVDLNKVGQANNVGQLHHPARVLYVQTPQLQEPAKRGDCLTLVLL